VTADQVVVRLIASAAPHEGRGHIGRALAVGEALVGLGARCDLQLVRGELTAHEARRTRDLGIAFPPAATPVSTGVAYVDLPDPNEASGRAGSERLAVMDDHDVFSERAALVIQPSQPRWTGPGRAGRILEGYEVVPIGAVYHRLRGAGRPDRRLADPPVVVACFGGSDPDMVSGRLASALTGAAWHLDLVIGAGYAGSTAGWPVEPIRDPTDLPERLATADVVVLGAGTMKFEAAFLGRPAILVAVADDQLPVGPAFAETGAAVYLGDGRTVEPARVNAALETLLADPARRAAMGRRAAGLIDGRGADRIAAALVDLAVGVGA
jgi:spore coat polysaccharide biosynthesis predicted glycosyltransferase SpsG